MCGLSQVFWLKCLLTCAYRGRCCCVVECRVECAPLCCQHQPSSLSSTCLIKVIYIIIIMSMMMLITIIILIIISSSNYSSSSSYSGWWSASAFWPENADAVARVHVGQRVDEHCGVPWVWEHHSELPHDRQRGPAEFPACFQHILVAHRVGLHAVPSTWMLFSSCSAGPQGAQDGQHDDARATDWRWPAVAHGASAAPGRLSVHSVECTHAGRARVLRSCTVSPPPPQPGLPHLLAPTTAPLALQS